MSLQIDAEVVQGPLMLGHSDSAFFTDRLARPESDGSACQENIAILTIMTSAHLFIPADYL